MAIERPITIVAAGRLPSARHLRGPNCPLRRKFQKWAAWSVSTVEPSRTAPESCRAHGSTSDWLWLLSLTAEGSSSPLSSEALVRLSDRLRIRRFMRKEGAPRERRASPVREPRRTPPCAYVFSVFLNSIAFVAFRSGRFWCETSAVFRSRSRAQFPYRAPSRLLESVPRARERIPDKFLAHAPIQVECRAPRGRPSGSRPGCY